MACVGEMRTMRPTARTSIESPASGVIATGAAPRSTMGVIRHCPPMRSNRTSWPLLSVRWANPAKPHTVSRARMNAWRFACATRRRGPTSGYHQTSPPNSPRSSAINRPPATVVVSPNRGAPAGRTTSAVLSSVRLTPHSSVAELAHSAASDCGLAGRVAVHPAGMFARASGRAHARTRVNRSQQCTLIIDLR